VGLDKTTINAMKIKKLTSAQRRRVAQTPDWSPQGVGLARELYAAALRSLFDRPVPEGQEQEWFWNIDEPEFDATPLEWTRIQTVLFANAGRDLGRFDNEQVGMGLNYVMSNAVSDVPFAAVHASVPIDDAMRMMRAMPTLWRECIGPRLAHVRQTIGAGGYGRLDFVCYMWFDVWPTFWQVRDQLCWQHALWHVFKAMLDTPCREVQVAALHGIGHHVKELGHAPSIDQTVTAFVSAIDPNDRELRNYAESARNGCVL
jgi:hypothetical protein